MTPFLPSPRPPGPRRSSARLGMALTAAGLLTLAVPSAAEAHVRVLADSTTTGSFSALTFRVPTESATASTVEVSVQLPQDHPFLDVSAKPVPGWTVSSTEQKLPEPATLEGTTLTKAVRTVTWTAGRGAGVAPGEYQEFALSVGPLPPAGTVLLPATQTYSDGTTVRWDEPTPASGEEPEHPAPALVVTAAAASPGPTGTFSREPAPTASLSTSRPDWLARGLGAGALVVALVGLGVALTGRRRRSAAR